MAASAATRSASWGLRDGGTAALQGLKLRGPPRTPCLPRPVHRLIEPYLPPPTPKNRRTATHLTSPLPPHARQGYLSNTIKVHVRPGVLAGTAVEPEDPAATVRNIRRTLRAALSVGDTESALSAAFKALDCQLLLPCTSDLEQQRSPRSKFYSLIIHRFLYKPTAANLDAVHKLFERQRSEGLAVHPPSLTIYLSVKLRNLAPFDSPMQTIASIFPFLPDTYDLHLLTLILTTTVRHFNPPPKDVKQMIKDSLPRDDGEDQAAMQKWDPELWDVYMRSLLAHGQLRQAIRDLAQFRSAVWAQQDKKADLPAGSREETNTSPAAITRTYISLFSYWVKFGYEAAREAESDSTKKETTLNIPRAIARHCFGTLRDTPPPVEFFNAWMAAELAGGNLGRAERIWNVVSGRNLEGSLLTRIRQDDTEKIDKGLVVRATLLEESICRGSQPGMSSHDLISVSLVPDATTYKTLFKLLKRLGFPPTRRLLRRFLDDVSIDAKSLTAALSTIFTIIEPGKRSLRTGKPTPVPDLPAALVLLQRFHPIDTGDIIPSARTVDVIAAGLLKVSRAGLPIFGEAGEKHQHGPRIGKRENIESDFSEESELERRISLREWDLISQELHALRELTQRTDDALLMLPVGQIFGRLIDEASPITQPIPAGQPSNSDITCEADVPPEEPVSPAIELLPALETLLWRAIAAQMVIQGERYMSDSKVDAVITAARIALGRTAQS